MRYNGNLCDGCHEPLLDGEDIVVCPECATPQHRHCYDKEDKCVNAHLHGTDFVWQGAVNEKTAAETSTLVNLNREEEKAGELTCPNCQCSNPAGSEVCRNCGMKFTMFGVNIVENLNEKHNPDFNSRPKDNDVPDYEAPFSVGTGEGFENIPTQETSTEPSYEPEVGSAEYFSNESNVFKGPYPDEDYTCGVKTNTIGAFVRNSAQVYIDKFKRSDITGRNGFNWAAFLFAPYWFFYRRLYKPGIVMLTVQLCISIITAPALTKFALAYESFLANIETMSDEVFAESMTQLQSLVVPALIVSCVSMAMHLISGIIANRLYKSYVIKNINYASNFATVREKINHFAKNGGTSIIAVMIAYFAETGLSYLASYLMY